jgi:hypothetical protein
MMFGQQRRNEKFDNLYEYYIISYVYWYIYDYSCGEVIYSQVPAGKVHEVKLFKLHTCYVMRAFSSRTRVRQKNIMLVM